MKTFVTDDYQIEVRDDDSLECRITKHFATDIKIGYNPGNIEPLPLWHADKGAVRGHFVSKHIYGLELTKRELEILHEALEVVGKQDLMDNEIVFVDKKEK